MPFVIAVVCLLVAGVAYMAATRPCFSHHHRHRHLRRARSGWAP